MPSSSARTARQRPVSTSSSPRFAFLLTCTAGYLDAYAMITHGTFAAAQTGNLVFIVMSLAQGNFSEHVNSVWSVIAFALGTGFAVIFNRTWRAEPHQWHPIRWLLGAQALVLAILGLLPASAPAVLVVVPLVAIAGMLFELFRTANGHKYVPVTMTGNMVRLIESFDAFFLQHKPGSGTAVRMNVSVISSYLGGALLSSLMGQLIGVRSIWLAVVGMLVLLSFFVLDERPAARQDADGSSTDDRRPGHHDDPRHDGHRRVAGQGTGSKTPGTGDRVGNPQDQTSQDGAAPASH